MSKVDTYRDIVLSDLIDCMDELENSSKNSIIFCEFDLNGGNPIDKSFVITKTNDKEWYVVEIYYPFSNKIDSSKTFCTYLDSDCKLHIDNNVNVV